MGFLSLPFMIRVGKLAATHGLKGELIFTHVTGDESWLKPGAVLFVELHKGSRIPYFVSSCRPVNEKEYMVRLEEVEIVEAARKLIGKQVYVEDALLQSVRAGTPLQWIGYAVEDRKAGEIGRIKDVLQTGHQWLAALSYHQKEVLIPLVEPILLKVMPAEKKIFTDLPEGLLDV